MSTKIEQLVEWCQTSNVIPASGTRARNDLADLVMGQPIEEIKASFKVFRDEPDSVKRWVWLVTNVCDFGSGIDLIYRTVLSHKWYQLQLEHEEEITKGWNEINAANHKIAGQLRDLDARELRMTATVNDLKATQNRLDDAYREIRDLRDEIGELREIKAMHDVFLQALRHGLWMRKPLTERIILDQYAEAVSCVRDLDRGYTYDECCKAPKDVIDNALAVFRETGMSPADLAGMAANWSLDGDENEGDTDD